MSSYGVFAGVVSVPFELQLVKDKHTSNDERLIQG